MKFRIFLSILYCLGFCNSFAYSDSTIKSKDFKHLTGCWKGSLTYLDYTTNRPYSMPANLAVKDLKKNSNLIICSLTYPKEPRANSMDTLFISNDGRSLNNEAVKSKRRFKNDSLKIVTEITSIDGNENKEAIIRHTYILGRSTYSIKKEVQFAGQSQWTLRNEYTFIRTKPAANTTKPPFGWTNVFSAFLPLHKQVYTKINLSTNAVVHVFTNLFIL